MIQLQFLNKLLQDGDTSLLTEHNLNEEYFVDYPKEYKFIKDHIDEYGVVPDKVSFLEKFPEFDMFAVSDSNQFLINKLSEERDRNYLISTFREVRDLVESDRISEAMNKLLTASNTATKSSSLKTVNILEDVSRYDEYVDVCNNFTKHFIKTGFKELDQLINGWDRHEELAVIVARTGLGKSWCLLKCAVAAAEQGLTVGIYSGEMSANKVGYRIDTLISHIPNKSLLRGNADVQLQYKRHLENVKDKIKGKIMLLTPNMIGGMATISNLRTFIEKDNLDILFIDQHSLLEDELKAKNPVEKAANISKGLKALQVMKQIPIISVSQQNRTSTDNGVGTEHIAQSDRISQDSTIVIFLGRDNDIVTMNLVKARDSENGKKLNYKVDLNVGMYEYLPDTEDALEGKDCQNLKNQYEYDDGEDAF